MEEEWFVFPSEPQGMTSLLMTILANVTLATVAVAVVGCSPTACGPRPMDAEDFGTLELRTFS